MSMVNSPKFVVLALISFKYRHWAQLPWAVKGLTSHFCRKWLNKCLDFYFALVTKLFQREYSCNDLDRKGSVGQGNFLYIYIWGTSFQEKTIQGLGLQLGRLRKETGWLRHTSIALASNSGRKALEIAHDLPFNPQATAGKVEYQVLCGHTPGVKHVLREYIHKKALVTTTSNRYAENNF